MATDIKTASQFEQGDRPEADALPSLTDDESHNLPATQKGKMITGVESSNDCLGPRGRRSPFGRGNSTALRLPRVRFRRCGESDEPDSGRDGRAEAERKRGADPRRVTMIDLATDEGDDVYRSVTLGLSARGENS
jgi:hypothetical protein